MGGLTVAMRVPPSSRWTATAGVAVVVMGGVIDAPQAAAPMQLVLTVAVTVAIFPTYQVPTLPTRRNSGRPVGS